MSDYFPFWMFCSVVAICITWYNIRKQRNALDPQGRQQKDEEGKKPEG